MAQAIEHKGLTKPKKFRNKAKGVSKVKTGCRTCKIRRKKCDELKPNCTQCLETQRDCDFSARIQIHVALQLNCSPLLEFEARHFEYFQEVCTAEFALYFELPLWQSLVLQAAYTEPCIRHAALAMGALSRTHYHPKDVYHQSQSVTEYSMLQYNLAIQKLNRVLATSSRSWELAILGSIIFIAIEVLQQHENKVRMLLENAMAVMRSHPKVVEGLRRSNYSIQTSLVPDTSFTWVDGFAPEMEYLIDALLHIKHQVSSFERFYR